MSNALVPPPGLLTSLLPSTRDDAWAARVNAQVNSRFNAFAAELRLTPAQTEEAAKKVKGIVRCLNKVYWGIDSETENVVIEGSWGKGTQTRPPRDVDMLFVLLVPEAATEHHLQLLSELAQMFSDRNFREQLAALPDAAAIHSLFAQWQSAS